MSKFTANFEDESMPGLVKQIIEYLDLMKGFTATRVSQENEKVDEPVEPLVVDEPAEENSKPKRAGKGSGRKPE